MPPKTAAERMKLYRARMNAEKLKQVREKNRHQQKTSRSKWSASRKNVEKENSKRRMRKSRLLRSNELSPASSPAVSPSKAFKSPQLLGRAIRKVKSALPKSPRKTIAVVKKLVVKFGIRMKTDQNKTNAADLSTVDKAINIGQTSQKYMYNKTGRDIILEV